MNLLCRLFGHRRSRSRAHIVNDVWHSVCKRCRARLVRMGRHNWRAEEAADEVAAR